MAEYIEREEALQFKLTRRCEKITVAQAVSDAIAAYIEAIPAADVAPVRHGRWEYDEEAGEYYCSECHRTTDDRHDEIQEYDGKKVIALCLPRFCGYCGARMDGGQDDV